MVYRLKLDYDKNRSEFFFKIGTCIENDPLVIYLILYTLVSILDYMCSPVIFPITHIQYFKPKNQ